MRAFLAFLWVGRKQAGTDRRLVLVALGLPVLIMLLVGIVFGTNKPAPLGIISNSKDQLSARIVDLLNVSGSVAVRTYSNEASLKDDIMRGRVVAGLIIPSNFTAQVESKRYPAMDLIAPVGQAPAVTAREAVGAAYDVAAAEWLAALSSSSINKVRFNQALKTAQIYTNGVSSYLDKKITHSMSPYSYTAPSNLVLFVFLTLFGSASAIVETRKLGIYRRVLATPTRPGSIVLSQTAGFFFLAFGQSVMLLVVGKYLFGVNFGPVLAVFCVVFALSLCAAGAGTILGTVAKTPDQAIAIGTVLGISLGMLGGCMWPLDIVGPLMRDIGHLAPQAWAMDAFVKLVYDGAGIKQVEPDVLVLLGFAVIMCIGATFRMRKMVTEG